MSLPAPEAPGAAQVRCPICSSERFIPFNGRQNARCEGCKSVERNRLLWMVLKAHGLFRPGQRVLHFAPELALARRFSELSGDRYHACDLNPERFGSRFVKVRRFDLCTDLEKLPSRSFDLILHSHVLEHLQCDVEQVLGELERILAPGGHHILSVPIRGETTHEDLSDDLTPQHRAMMFGQDDHFRIFGSRDLADLLGRVWGEGEDHLIEPLQLFSAEDLTTAAIPPEAWTGASSHSLWMHRRPLRRPAPPRPQDPAAEPSLARPEGARLILHIGMPRTGAASQQGWLRANREPLSRAGLVTWGAAENPSELMFHAVADPERVARGTMWFQKGQDRAQDAGRRLEARGALEAWLGGLQDRTGLISAESLWTLQPREIQDLAGLLAAHGVQGEVICWVRAPAEYVLSAMQQPVRAGLGLAAGIEGLEREAPLKYSRLDGWIDAFGRDRIEVRMFGPDEAGELAAALGARGIVVAPPPVSGSEAPAAGLTLPGGKALLALNQRRNEAGKPAAASRLLKQVLEGLEGEPFALPEAAVRRLRARFGEEAAYLSERFGFPIERIGLESAGIDDDAFLRWTDRDVAALLAALDDALLAAEAKGPADQA